MDAGLFEVVGSFLRDYGGHIGAAGGVSVGIALTRVRAIERSTKAFAALLREMRVFPDTSDDVLKPNPLLPIKKYILERVKAVESVQAAEVVRRFDGQQLDYIARRIEERGARTTLPDESTSGKLAMLQKQVHDLQGELHTFKRRLDDSEQEASDLKRERREDTAKWRKLEGELGEIERNLRKWAP